MRNIVMGNWKMSGTKSFIDSWLKDFFESLMKYAEGSKEQLPEVAICAPAILFPYLEQEYNKIVDGDTKGAIRELIDDLKLGIQTCSLHDKGAYTGEIALGMLEGMDCKYVLVGHSERRKYHAETDEIVSQKTQKIIEAGYTPVVCIGESLETREAGEHKEFIKKQVLDCLPAGVDMDKLVVAYEPIWAIGTGLTATTQQVEEMNAYIKEVVSKDRGVSEDKVVVLYGGSVKPANAKDILGLKSVNGVLVGGASLKPVDFFDIVQQGK